MWPVTSLVGSDVGSSLPLLPRIAVDVCLSADNVPHIIHDPTVDRTTDGRGPGAS